ncbi:MAG: Transcriptional regulator, IclR family [Burkholderiaceae bacterium]|jgi:DNA-binding IclR family transcriptional regulator|nr:MAG: Transcriptional regulator, IclR family [Burkholderiaceae bacterium]
MNQELLDPQDAGDDGPDRYNVPALERGLRLLGEFSRDTRTLTAPELARRFKLPRSTVFRLLSTLETLGFVERDEGGREYRLGPAVLRLGFEYLASLPLNELGQPLLERLSDASGHACNLIVRDGRSIVYVARVSPPSPFVSSVSVGTRLPAHATVLGRILLTDLSLPELRELYPEPQLEAFSANTPRTVTELFDLVQQDRQRGYAVSEGFFEASISTIAAPVRDHTDRVVAALGLTINSGRIEASEIDALVSEVRATADQLSALLNHAPTVSAGKLVPLRSARRTA